MPTGTDWIDMTEATYAGDLEVTEVWRRLSEDPGAVLIDVRTSAEWNYVGIPDLSSLGKQALLLPWQEFPAMTVNPEFTAQVAQSPIGQDTNIFLICRSGQRSRNAAAALTAAGYRNCFNVAAGFEGDKDPAGHRGTTNGWKVAGLPWIQG
jgi:rhodanese-related sulfurtransferase